MIKRIFNPGSHTQSMNYVLILLRLAIGVLMLTHGVGKFLKLFGDEPISFADPIGIGETASLVLAVFAEVVCSILIILGLVTRLSVIPLMVTMFVAVFIIHAGDEFKVLELPLLYLLVYFTIAFTGPGKFSIDKYIYDIIEGKKGRDEIKSALRGYGKEKHITYVTGYKS